MVVHTTKAKADIETTLSCDACWSLTCAKGQITDLGPQRLWTVLSVQPAKQGAPSVTHPHAHRNLRWFLER